MNDTLFLLIAFVLGILLGVIFFGSLWWAVQKGMVSKRPVLWFFGGSLLRTSITLAGFYFIGNGHWQRMLVCLLGFIIARFIVKGRVRPSVEKPKLPEEEVIHANKSR